MIRCPISLRAFDCGRKAVVSRCLMCVQFFESFFEWKRAAVNVVSECVVPVNVHMNVCAASGLFLELY